MPHIQAQLRETRLPSSLKTAFSATMFGIEVENLTQMEAKDISEP
jgi:hypothetical protein